MTRGTKRGSVTMRSEGWFFVFYFLLPCCMYTSSGNTGRFSKQSERGKPSFLLSSARFPWPQSSCPFRMAELPLSVRELVVAKDSCCSGCNVEVGGVLRRSLSLCEIEVGTCFNVLHAIFDRVVIAMEVHSVFRRRGVRGCEGGGIEVFRGEDVVVHSLTHSGDVCRNGGFRGEVGTLRGVGGGSDG